MASARGDRGARAVVFGALIALAACRAEDVTYRCVGSDQCVREGVPGVCEPVGACSFPDDTCKSKRRYGQLAGGAAAGACVSCGDAVVDPGEECDDGNDRQDDGCMPSCLRARCGDGIVRKHVEQCDRGDATGSDGCSALCRRCEPGPNRFEWSGNGHCYFRTETATTWQDARAACLAAGAHLATYTNNYERNEVNARLCVGRASDAWFGLTTGAGGGFQWVSNEPVVVNAWEAMEPKVDPARACAVHRPSNTWRTEMCAAAREALCEEPGWEVDPATGRAYRAVFEPVSWDKAKEGCALLAPGAHLATVTSAAEHAFIADHFPGDRWIGATDAQIEGQFAWVNGEPFGFARFAPEDPDDAGGIQDCIILGGERLWHDRGCPEAYPYVCELE